MDAAVTPQGVAELIDFALEALPAMRLEDGVFCFERRAGQVAPIGRSPRYTLMVQLGLLRAEAAGYELPFSVEEIAQLCWRELEAGRLTPGDIGLLLWIETRSGGDRATELAKRLDSSLEANGGLRARLGM